MDAPMAGEAHALVDDDGDDDDDDDDDDNDDDNDGDNDGDDDDDGDGFIRGEDEVLIPLETDAIINVVFVKIELFVVGFNSECDGGDDDGNDE